jgi:glycosyltransferase involved in cell wall biosynthesis
MNKIITNIAKMNEKKKILVFIDWFLPGYKAGGPITSVANLTNRLKSDFEFFIITRNTDYMESTPYVGIESDAWVNFDINVKVFYLSKQNINKKFIKQLTNSVKFDTAYINGIYSYYFSILPLTILKKSPKKIIVCSRGMLSKQAFSRKSIKKRGFLFLAKIWRLYKNTEFHATNEEEKRDILSVLGKKKITVVPNIPRKMESSNPSPKEKVANSLSLVSIARISHEKNLKFALEVLTNCTKGSIRFDIYGSIYDKAYWDECLQVITKMPPNVKVTHHEPIESSKVIETFTKYHFSFMPSIGENFGHSLFESMIAGTPVITSKNTPWQNLEEKSVGWDIDLLNIKKFIEVIQECNAMTHAEYLKKSENAFNFALSFSNDKSIISNAIQLFQS